MIIFTKLKLSALSLIMLAGLVFVGLPSIVLAAAPKSQADCPSGTSFNPGTKKCGPVDTAISPGGLPTPATNETKVRTILEVVFGIVGALALLMIAVSGLRYILSGGDPGRITKAKDGIVYALVGLLIALIAEAIVAFVVGRL